MKINLAGLLLFVLFVASQTTYAVSDAELENLFVNRQYFELRERLSNNTEAETTNTLFYRGIIENRFDNTQKSITYLQKFLKKVKADDAKIRAAYETLADNFLKTHQYGKAADTYQHLLAKFGANDSNSDNYKNLYGLWNSLRNVRPQRVSAVKETTLQGTRDKARLLNISVEISGQKSDFVFDTGANLSTITASTASRLNLKIIESDVSVGSATDKSVKSKLAVASEMKIGNATVHNAVFLVLEDKSLFFPQINYQINGIVGFPVIKSLGKVTITKADEVIISKSPKPEKTSPNMCLEGLTPLVLAEHFGQKMIFAFDTGANNSMFYPKFFKANETKIKKDYKEEKIRFGSAGGFTEVAGYNILNLELSVGNNKARFVKAAVISEPFNEQSRQFYGRLGQDLIKQFARMTLDFNSMKLVFE